MPLAKNNELNARTCPFCECHWPSNFDSLVWTSISTSEKSMSECYVRKVYRLSTLKRSKLFPENQEGSGRIRFGWLVLSSRRKASCLGHKREKEAQVKTLFSHKKIVIFHFHNIWKCLKSLSFHFIHRRYFKIVSETSCSSFESLCKVINTAQ